MTFLIKSGAISSNSFLSILAFSCSHYTLQSVVIKIRLLRAAALKGRLVCFVSEVCYCEHVTGDGLLRAEFERSLVCVDSFFVGHLLPFVVAVVEWLACWLTDR